MSPSSRAAARASARASPGCWSRPAPPWSPVPARRCRHQRRGTTHVRATCATPRPSPRWSRAIVAEHGRLDVVVNNAGGAPYAEAATASPRFTEKVLGAQPDRAPLHVAQAANTVMQQQGSGAIVNISSVSALRPSPGTAAYGAAKAGLDSLTRSLAVEWGPTVRVNSVDVGLCRTEQTVDHYGGDDTVAAIEQTIPLGRMARARRGRPRGGLPGLRPGLLRLGRLPRVPRRRRAPCLPTCPEGELMTLLDGRVAIVTGAGRGIGRAHALELARQGAKVVVNDLGTSRLGRGIGQRARARGRGARSRPLGGEAVANGADVADFAQAEAMVQQAIDTFGGLDILVNNAGLRARPDAGEHLRGGVGRRHPGAPQGPLRPAAPRRRLVAGRGQGGPPAGRARGQHQLGSRDAGLGRPDDVLRRQGRHRRHDPGRGRRARALRRATSTRSRRSRAPG